MRKCWTKEEELILQKHYKHMSTSEIQATYLSNYTIPAIKAKAKIIGACRKKLHLTNEDISYIRDNFPTTGTAEIAKKIGCSYSKISNIASCLKIKKTKEYIQICGREASQHEAAVAKRFKKGHIPANKGKSWDEMNIPAETKVNMLKTAYKKGHTPHNTEKVGYIIKTKDGYLKIKTGNPNQWKLLHRLVWEKYKGVIPAGMNVQFVDGDRGNCNIDNLYLISRSDQVTMNKTHCPRELIKSIKYISKINKILKSYGKQ